MPDANQFKQRRPKYTLLLNGLFGSGKTLQAHSFPKCYTLSVDPDGLEVLRQPKHAAFLNNLVWFEELNADGKNDLRALFNENAKAEDRTSLYGCLRHAAEMAKAGEVKTLVVDGGTYLVGMLWEKINEEEKAKANGGDVDRWGVYRSLGIQLQRLFASTILTMATRAQLSVIVTFHLRRESEATLEGTTDKKTGLKSARKLTLDSDLAIQIEGGFRNKIEGLFSGSLYLERKLKDIEIGTGEEKRKRRVVDYKAICDLTTGFGTVVTAKSRYGLPARLDLNNQTLYEALSNVLAGKATAGK